MLNAEAASVPAGADGVTFLPYLQGERTPHRDASARGAFLGLSLAHTRAHLTRAVVEGIASRSATRSRSCTSSVCRRTSCSSPVAARRARSSGASRLKCTAAGDNGESRGRSGVRRGAARRGRCGCLPRSPSGGCRDPYPSPIRAAEIRKRGARISARTAVSGVVSCCEAATGLTSQQIDETTKNKRQQQLRDRIARARWGRGVERDAEPLFNPVHPANPVMLLHLLFSSIQPHDRSSCATP